MVWPSNAGITQREATARESVCQSIIIIRFGLAGDRQDCQSASCPPHVLFGERLAVFPPSTPSCGKSPGHPAQDGFDRDFMADAFGASRTSDVRAEPFNPV